MNVTRNQPRLRCAPKALFGIYAAILLLAGLFFAAAQQQDAPAPANDALQPEDLSLTNLVELFTDSAADTEPAADAATSNGGTNEIGASSSSSADSYRRPSGRESRSQRFSRSKSGRSNGSSRDYGSSSGGSYSGSGSTNRGPASLEWPAFQVVVAGNIFDPNRRPRTRGIVRPPETTRARDYFTLVGTMSYEDGTFAFFNGSSSEFEKALKRSDIIAGYKVAAIDPDFVKLSRETNQVELRVGMQMRRDDDGSWFRSSSSPAYNERSFEPAPSSTTGSASPSDAGPSADSDVIKRMMERREKE
jgi:hypothetical protein